MTVLEKLANIKEKFARKAATETEAAASDFDRLVRQLADEKDPGEQTVADVLDRTGKTIDELTQAVQVLLERRRLVTLMAEEPKARKAIEQASADLEAAKDRHVQAERDWIAARETYGTITNLAADTLRKASQAREFLIGGCRDKAALNRWSIAFDKATSLQNQLSQQRQTLGDGSQGIIGGINQAERELQMAQQSGLAKQMVDCQAALDGFRASRSRVEATVKTLEAELRTARAELDEIEAVVCQP